MLPLKVLGEDMFQASLLAVVQLPSCVRLFVTPWTEACRCPLSFTISWSLPRFTSIELVMLSNHLILCHPLLLLPSVFPSIRFVPMSQLITSGGHNIEASALILTMNIQCWFPLGLIGLISLQPRKFSGVFSSTTIRKHQFFSAQPSLWSNSYIHIWLLEKSELWLYGPFQQSDSSAF